VKIDLSVRLPVDTDSLPLIRGVVRRVLEHLGVVTDGIDEILLALSEACTNVVQHAGEHDEYQVDVAIDDQVCRISVLDHGAGFDPAAVAAVPRTPLEGGGGLVLMRALVDRLAFVQAADGRHRVTLEKHLLRKPRLRLLGPG
jgi:anti-sigma regulatory factor (Ser/Thr protein kinase)